MTFRQFIRFLTLAVCLLGFVSEALSAMRAGRGRAWLTVSSQSTPQKAIAEAKRYSLTFQNVVVFSSTSGWYGVSLGWAGQAQGDRLVKQLVRQGLIPDDSYFHTGERFIEAIWSSSGVTGRAVSRLVRVSQFTPPGINISQPDVPGRGGIAYVSGLRNTSDSFLSLRAGPRTSEREILRMPANTRLTILSQNGGWYLVRLETGNQGWAFGKYITQGSPTGNSNGGPVPQMVIDNSMDGQLAKVAGLSRSGDGFLALRKGPTSRAQEVARLQPETRMTIRGKSGDWYKVDVRSDIGGWVFSRYVALVEVPVIGPDVTSNEVPVIGPDTNEVATTPEASTDIQVVVSNPSETKVQTQSEKTDLPGISVGKRRVALVLGNSAYQHTLALPNPKNDAAKMSERLKILGFEVITGIDGTWVDMRNSIREFVKILPDSDAALFFYAGHAMQIKGKNYLIPIDAKLEDATSIDFETIELASVLGFIADSERVSIALLDACRDNPLSRKFARSFGATRSAFIGQGLSVPTTARGNVLIGFSTAPGEVALDGDGDNSPFTTALLKHMSTPDMEIEIMLKRVKSDVYEETGHQQEPWNNSGLRSEFYFNKTVSASSD